jgi:hypothetical protein
MSRQWVLRFKGETCPIICGTTDADPSKGILTQVAEEINQYYPFLSSLKYEVRLEEWTQKVYAGGLVCPECGALLGHAHVAKNLLWPVRCGCGLHVTLPIE